jgi:hypothetical protein
MPAGDLYDLYESTARARKTQRAQTDESAARFATRVFPVLPPGYVAGEAFPAEEAKKAGGSLPCDVDRTMIQRLRNFIKVMVWVALSTHNALEGGFDPLSVLSLMLTSMYSPSLSDSKLLPFAVVFHNFLQSDKMCVPEI